MTNGLAAVLIAGATLLTGQSLPVEPVHESGDSVTGAFEGWFRNPDGSFSLLLGYYNRNRKQELDIPVGPNNRLEPGGPDRGQPTHFMPGRGWGMFSVKVPAEFGQQKITWRLVANGKATQIPASLHPDYEISPFVEAAVGNTPPVLSFEENGPTAQGPLGLRTERRTTLRNPLTLTVWVSDDAKFTSSSGARPRNLGSPVIVRWTKYRGPGDVRFGQDRPPVEKLDVKGAATAFHGKAITTAAFSEPGEYVLHVVANDYSGDGGTGFQCCWTNGLVKVSVEP